MNRFNDFKLYCRTLSDAQLEAVLAKEWAAGEEDDAREDDYEAAVSEAERRGWSVLCGVRS